MSIERVLLNISHLKNCLIQHELIETQCEYLNNPHYYLSVINIDSSDDENILK